MGKASKLIIVGLSLGVILGSQTIVNGASSLYENYNEERGEKLEIQSKIEKYENNAILNVAGIQQWNMLDKKSKVEPKGKFESLAELYSGMDDNLNSHKDYYKTFKENDEKPIELQQQLDPLSDLDYLSVSEVSVHYYYDVDEQQVSQLIRITSLDKVYRCTIIYNMYGEVVNYYEA